MVDSVGVGGPPMPRLPGSYSPVPGGLGLPAYRTEQPLGRHPFFRPSNEMWVLPPMMLVSGLFMILLNFIQPMLKSPKDAKEAVFYEALFAALMLVWTYLVNWRRRRLLASKNAAQQWTDTGESDGLPVKDWRSATAPPDGYSLLQLQERPEQPDAPRFRTAPAQLRPSSPRPAAALALLAMLPAASALDNEHKAASAPAPRWPGMQWAAVHPGDGGAPARQDTISLLSAGAAVPPAMPLMPLSPLLPNMALPPMMPRVPLVPPPWMIHMFALRDAVMKHQGWKAWPAGLKWKRMDGSEYASAAPVAANLAALGRAPPHAQTPGAPQPPGALPQPWWQPPVAQPLAPSLSPKAASGTA